MLLYFFFFFKQKTAYEMRISDWSSDVCSSDLRTVRPGGRPAPYAAVESAADLARAIEAIGAPGILKTAREGYDGKGQWRIGRSAERRVGEDGVSQCRYGWLAYH